MLAYRDMGYLPDALMNYLVRLGWSYGDQEIFTRQQLIGYFSFENVGKAAAVFNPEKLLWLNGQYIINTPAETLSALVMPFLSNEGVVSAEHEIDAGWLARAVLTLRERAKTLAELAGSLRYYISEYVEYDEKAKAKFLNEKSLELLRELRDSLSALPVFSVEGLEKAFKAIVERNGIKLGGLAQPARVAVTGRTESPGIFEVIEILGREKTMKRLEKAIEIAGAKRQPGQ